MRVKSPARDGNPPDCAPTAGVNSASATEPDALSNVRANSAAKSGSSRTAGAKSIAEPAVPPTTGANSAAKSDPPRTAKIKSALRAATDLALAAALPALMLGALTGRRAHEWLGAAFAALFTAHHLLNLGWWRGLFRGGYTPARVFTTALNLLMLADVAAVAVSGAAMSRYVFAFLPVKGTALAREVHLVAAYWGLVLMSAHLGAHWAASKARLRRLFRVGRGNAVTKRVSRGVALAELGSTASKWVSRRSALAGRGSAAAKWISRGLSLAGCWYGVYAFIKRHIADYLFHRAGFVMFDYSLPPAAHAAELLGVIFLFAAAGYCCSLLMKRLGRPRRGQRPHGA